MDVDLILRFIDPNVLDGRGTVAPKERNMPKVNGI
jgi:hypothetical protein